MARCKRTFYFSGGQERRTDSGGNEIDEHGEIKDWRDLEKTIARLKAVIARAKAVDTIEEAKAILEEA